MDSYELRGYIEQGIAIRVANGQRAGRGPLYRRQKLTTWTVLNGGTRIRMNFVGIDGAAHSLVLSFDVLSSLLMTLPRMLQTALDARFSDGSLRFVHQHGTWRIEQSQTGVNFILRLETPDGFDVAFALTDHHANSLGAALMAAPTTEKSGMRRPN